jgi:hypothetical protein
MKGFAKIMLIVLLATPAYAQVPNLNLLGDSGKIKTQEEVDAEAARDNAYKSAIKKVPAQAAKTDPWGNIRGGGAAQSQTQARPNQK